MNNIFLQLGSNLDERKVYLEKASGIISNEIGNILQKSRIYESTPWAVENQNNYLNQVIKIESTFTANEVLSSVLTIEEKMGRVRNERWGERIIDIDILFYNEEIIEKEGLFIPHIHIQKRRFVLVPLNDVAPDFIHPKYNKTISVLLKECNDNEKVEVYAV